MEEANQNISGSAGRTSGYQKPEIEIYDASGRLVKWLNLESSIENQGSAISWRGDDDAGMKLPGGVYFIKLTAGNLEETKKVLLIR
jgi:flagellar hook assembly protein FlgD